MTTNLIKMSKKQLEILAHQKETEIPLGISKEGILTALENTPTIESEIDNDPFAGEY